MGCCIPTWPLCIILRHPQPEDEPREPQAGLCLSPLGGVRLTPVLPEPLPIPSPACGCGGSPWPPSSAQPCPKNSPCIRTGGSHFIYRKESQADKETSATKVPVTAGFCALFTGQNISTTSSIDFFVKQIHLTVLMGTHGAQVTKAKWSGCSSACPGRGLAGTVPLPLSRSTHLLWDTEGCALEQPEHRLQDGAITVALVPCGAKSKTNPTEEAT